MVHLLAAMLLLQDVDRVRVDPAGDVTLAPRNSVLRRQADPSKFDVITEMIVYRGRLIATACMDFDETSIYQASAYSTEAQLVEFLPDKGEWTVLREFQQSMLFNSRVIDGLLMVPEYFPMNDRSRRIHTFDGKEWGELGLLPQETWHIMDVLRIGDALYCSGSWRDLDPDARQNDPNWMKGYGHVFESKDNGKTWKDIRRSKDNGRCLDMVEFKGRLYCNERGFHLISWDGKAWTEIPVRFDGAKVDAKLGSAHLMTFADRIVAINADLIYTYDGKKWTSAQPGYIDLWREGNVLYGLREDGHVASTTDALKWTTVTTKEGVPAKEFDRQATKGRPIHRGAIAMHRGRLFVGTGAEGFIYAAAYEEKGSLTSKPEKIEAGAKLSLSWEATAGVRLRWRSAASQDDLAKASWKDAAASPAEVAPAKKHRWVQWRADFEGDGAKSPVLRAVKLAP